MAAPVSSQFVEPTLESFFDLPIGNEYEPGWETATTRWANPYLEQSSVRATPSLSVIKAYIPAESLIFTVAAESGFLNHDVTAIILSNLDLKDLVDSSSVCKLFCSAARSDYVWRVQLRKYLPNVTAVAPNLCNFTPEQQYKIIFKRIENECKPYIAKFNHNEGMCDILLDRLEETFDLAQEAGLQETDADGRLGRALGKLQQTMDAMQNLLSTLAGPNYDGTIDSIDPNSFQGKILNAIKVLVPNAFNDQVKFESVIEKSVAALNTSSSNSDGPTIEDVTDVAEPSEKNG